MAKIVKKKRDNELPATIVAILGEGRKTRSEIEAALGRPVYGALRILERKGKIRREGGHGTPYLLVEGGGGTPSPRAPSPRGSPAGTIGLFARMMREVNTGQDAARVREDLVRCLASLDALLE